MAKQLFCQIKFSETPIKLIEWIKKIALIDFNFDIFSGEKVYIEDLGRCYSRTYHYLISTITKYYYLKITPRDMMLSAYVSIAFLIVFLISSRSRGTPIAIRAPWGRSKCAHIRHWCWCGELSFIIVNNKYLVLYFYLEWSVAAVEHCYMLSCCYT